jgi:transcriptional regulator with XRE-family HTH domain
VDNLKNLRSKADLTQFELSQRSGVSRWKLSMVENHQLALHPEETEAVLAVLTAAFHHNAKVFSKVLSEDYPD